MVLFEVECDGQWQHLPTDVCEQIAASSVVDVEMKGHKYTIDLVNGHQTNHSTGIVRPIRQVGSEKIVEKIPFPVEVEKIVNIPVPVEVEKIVEVEVDRPIDSNVPHSRVFAPASAHGGEKVDPMTTALVMIEYQNEFTTEGGKLHDGVKGVMESTNMLAKSVEVCEVARSKGCKIIHSPIIFAPDKSDNPNKGQGILKGCADGELFLEGTWNAEICEPMTPKEGDYILKGKKGLDAFPGSNLQTLLVANNITTVVLGGLLTNCCVESTMRTAYEKGYNVITLKDCTACNSPEAQTAAVDGTYNLFSTPMTKDEFVALLG